MANYSIILPCLNQILLMSLELTLPIQVMVLSRHFLQSLFLWFTTLIFSQACLNFRLAAQTRTGVSLNVSVLILEIQALEQSASASDAYLLYNLG